MDGKSSAPKNVRVNCSFDKRDAIVSVSWEEPDDPQGMIMEYSVTLNGNASYQDEHGVPKHEVVGPVNKAVLVGQQRKFEFTKQPPNTQFFVR